MRTYPSDRKMLRNVERALNNQLELAAYAAARATVVLGLRTAIDAHRQGLDAASWLSLLLREEDIDRANSLPAARWK